MLRLLMTGACLLALSSAASLAAAPPVLVPQSARPTNLPSVPKEILRDGIRIADQYPVDVQVWGPGKVRVGPALCDEKSPCSVKAALGDTLTVVTLPLDGAVFDSWTGACAQETGPTCTLTVGKVHLSPSDRVSIIAKFKPKPDSVKFTVSVPDRGGYVRSLNPGVGLNCVNDALGGTQKIYTQADAGKEAKNQNVGFPSTCSVSVPYGTQLQVEGVATLNGQFSNFSNATGPIGMPECQGQSCTFVMKDDRQVKANFFSTKTARYIRWNYPDAPGMAIDVKFRPYTTIDCSEKPGGRRECMAIIPDGTKVDIAATKKPGNWPSDPGAIVTNWGTPSPCTDWIEVIGTTHHCQFTVSNSVSIFMK